MGPSSASQAPPLPAYSISASLAHLPYHLYRDAAAVAARGSSAQAGEVKVCQRPPVSIGDPGAYACRCLVVPSLLHRERRGREKALDVGIMCLGVDSWLLLGLRVRWAVRYATPCTTTARSRGAQLVIVRNGRSRKWRREQ